MTDHKGDRWYCLTWGTLWSGKMVCVLLYLHNGKTKLSKMTQIVQTSVLKLMYAFESNNIDCLGFYINLIM